VATQVLQKFGYKVPNQEIELVQKAMGFRYPATIEFDKMDLSNEDAEKALLIQLADRNIISDELLQSVFGFDPDMEKSRLNKESKDRQGERMVKKAGPWHDPQVENALKKIALQGGIVTPSQVGLDLEKKKSGEKTALELKVPTGPSLQPTKLANAPSSDALPKEAGEGRPKMSKDSSPRKTRKFTPQTGAKLTLWANSTQDKISNIINPVLLEFYGKKNLRSLSNTEAKELEQIKTNILLNTDPLSSVEEDKIMASFEKSLNSTSQLVHYQHWLKSLQSELGRELSVEENKQAKASYYLMVYSDIDQIGE
jgi:hypothetical protein